MLSRIPYDLYKRGSRYCSHFFLFVNCLRTTENWSDSQIGVTFSKWGLFFSKVPDSGEIKVCDHLSHWTYCQRIIKTDYHQSLQEWTLHAWWQDDTLLECRLWTAWMHLFLYVYHCYMNSSIPGAVPGCMQPSAILLGLQLCADKFTRCWGLSTSRTIRENTRTLSCAVHVYISS